MSSSAMGRHRFHLIALLAAFALYALAGSARAADLQDSVRRYRATHEAQIVGQLDELTRFRSVAADPTALAATANKLQAWLKDRGFEARLLSEAEGPPLVFGFLRAPGARRTVVFYAHYDGQPVTPSQWKTDPFTPVMRSGPLNSGEHEVNWKADATSTFDPQWRLFARSASDDKASIIAFLAAFDALKATGHKLTVNVKVAWEGEEERGSPHLAALLRTYHDLLTSDLWLIGDGPVHQSRRPMLYFGARGTLGFQLTVYGPLRPLHDGHYGNWVPNPAAMAANLVAQMRDDEGTILIPGFAADVRPLSAPELSAIAALPPVESSLREEFAVGRTEGHEGLPASLMRPALNIRGIRSGQVGSEAANAIPTEAVVSMDLRLVPDQTPAAVRANIEAFLRAKGWTIVTAEPDMATRRSNPRLVRLEWESGYPALRSDMASPAAKAVRLRERPRLRPCFTRAVGAAAHDGRQRTSVYLSPILSRCPSSAFPLPIMTTTNMPPTKICGCRTCGTSVQCIRP